MSLARPIPCLCQMASNIVVRAASFDGRSGRESRLHRPTAVFEPVGMQYLLEHVENFGTVAHGFREGRRQPIGENHEFLNVDAGWSAWGRPPLMMFHHRHRQRQIAGARSSAG